MSRSEERSGACPIYMECWAQSAPINMKGWNTENILQDLISIFSQLPVQSAQSSEYKNQQLPRNFVDSPLTWLWRRQFFLLNNAHSRQESRKCNFLKLMNETNICKICNKFCGSRAAVGTGLVSCHCHCFSAQKYFPILKYFFLVLV